MSSVSEWANRNFDALSVQIAGALVVAAILATLGWLIRRRRRLASTLAAKKAEEAPPKASDPLSGLERRVLRRMFARDRQLVIDRRTDRPSRFRYGSLSPKGWLAADRWFFVLKGLAGRGLLNWARDDHGGNVFVLNEKGLELCVKLFGTRWHAAVQTFYSWLAEWWPFALILAWVVGFACYHALKSIS